MNRQEPDGYINGLALSLIVVSIIALAAIVFGVWAFSGKQTYKNNTNAMIAMAVQAEKSKEENLMRQQFNIANENPFTSYTGPQQYGSVYVSYPKNWSGYVDDTGSSGGLLEGYFEPGIVPAIGSQTNNFALRIEINNSEYSAALANFTSEQQTNNLTITPYKLKNVPSVIGVIIQGQIEPNKQGTLVMFPLRTNTLEIWTESVQDQNLFTTQILPTVSFRP